MKQQETAKASFVTAESCRVPGSTVRDEQEVGVEEHSWDGG